MPSSIPDSLKGMKAFAIIVILLVGQLAFSEAIDKPVKGCIMAVDSAAENALKQKTKQAYRAYKSIRTCKILVSDKMGECSDLSSCENPTTKPCHLVKQDGDSSFNGFSGDFEGARLEPKKEYVLEVERLTAHIETPWVDDCTGGEGSYDKYIVKRIISESKK